MFSNRKTQTTCMAGMITMAGVMLAGSDSVWAHELAGHSKATLTRAAEFVNNDATLVKRQKSLVQRDVDNLAVTSTPGLKSPGSEAISDSIKKMGPVRPNDKLIPPGSFYYGGPDPSELRFYFLHNRDQFDANPFKLIPYRMVPSLANDNLRYA